jgi:hypothetical protein
MARRADTGWMTNLRRWLVVAWLGSLAWCSPLRLNAYYTNFLDTASNQLSIARLTLTNGTAQERQVLKALNSALAELSRPSASVAGDYALFLGVALRLGTLAATPEFAAVGNNTFLMFLVEANVQAGQTRARIDALNPFVRAKRLASNTLARAEASLVLVPTLTNAQVALFTLGQVYSQLEAAKKLAAAGERNPGHALDSFAERSLSYTVRGVETLFTFANATDFSATSSNGAYGSGTYTYQRSGLNAGTLVLDYGAGVTSTYKLTFSSTSGGKFSYREAGATTSRRGSGKFVLPLRL